MKKALITGITGQDGSYLAELLIKKGYVVHGIKRRSSSLNSERIDHIYQKPQIKKPSFILHYGDLTDSSNITNIINQINPDEIYNLGAQSHVGNSFEIISYCLPLKFWYAKPASNKSPKLILSDEKKPFCFP